jgi:GNAT superfamily N-acetyltransferase
VLNQRTLSSLEFRDFHPEDYPRLVEIYNANFPDYSVSVSEQRTWDESLDPSKYLLKRFSTTDKTGRVLGFGQIRHELDAFHPRKFYLNIFVDPAEQGEGVGGAIYRKIEEELGNLEAISATTVIKEDLPRQREFFDHRGFREVARIWESRLDLRTIDTTKFQAYITKAEKEGIIFTDLTNEPPQSGSLRGIHELVQLITADMPREGVFTPISYEQWQALVFNSDRLLPEGYILAKRGPEFVGISNVYKNEKEPRNLSQDDTGVRREYRGRGIATALKLKVIEFGQKNGYEMIKTWNDSNNPAMLAVNTKLGFKRQVGWVRMAKELRQDA